MDINPPLLQTYYVQGDCATLLDFFAGNLYESAIDIVGNMSNDELQVLAEAAGCERARGGTFITDLDKMFACKAYQIAEGMLEARERLKEKFKKQAEAVT